MSDPAELAKAVVEAADRIAEARRAIQRASDEADRAGKAYDAAVEELAKCVGPNRPRRAIVVGGRVVFVAYREGKRAEVDVVDAVVAR